MPERDMKDTFKITPAGPIVVNLWAGPGAGKSTLAAGLYNLFKNNGVPTELVMEYAKDLTYEANSYRLSNQLLILAEQYTRLDRLKGKVSLVITDSPLPLGIAYTPPKMDWIEQAALAAYRQFNNVDLWVRRTKPYATYGRNETELQAITKDREIRDLYSDYADYPVGHVTGDRAGLLHAFDLICTWAKGGLNV